ncbi:SDR family NAD(P)-dependent oxidoreductase [Rhizobium sp. LjRoot258]|uniref:SDR family NAD(P)-dependent oxidoreductase n=1 Tax=Rhizobium sp. LjRoot258 TaxID=3342299 RepID=UPI003ECFF33E
MKRDSSITWRRVEKNSLDLTGLNVAVIGGTGGIGRSLAQDFAKQGGDVLVVGQTFRDAKTKNISFLKADLSLLVDAKRVADEMPVEKLDLVVMTTGIMAGPKREVTAEGIERDLAVSYLSRYVILNAIAPRLGKARSQPGMKPRVFVMGFPGSGQSADEADLNSEKRYGRMKAHMNTVAGNEALVLDVARRFPDIDVFGLNAGFVKTGIRGNLFGSNKLILKIIEGLTGFMTIDPEVYSTRIAPMLVSPDLEGLSAAMFNNQAEAILPSKNVADPSYIRAVVGASDRLVGSILTTDRRT